ncbi:MAG: COX15/CtaA family protein [Rhodobacteraceae bacterium]|nr:COX15/CtaA family protein [Paracoccaceae bacterium]
MSKTRSIFEEVGTEAPVDKPLVQPGAIDRAARRGARGAVRIWLTMLFVLIAAMLVLGGVARLTGNTLVLPGWNPVQGAIPPLDPGDWLATMERYRVFGEPGPGLVAFQRIYWWEWARGMLAPLAGGVWLLGLAGFGLAGRMPKGWTLRLLGLGGLIVALGGTGWGMGQAPAPFDGPSYRLLVETGLGFALLGLLAWFIFKLRRTEAELIQARRARDGAVFGMATGLMHLAFLQILLGGLLGGLDAGRGFTDWPTMAGAIVPPDVLSLQPVWRNFAENPGLVQFLHRGAGYLVLILGLVAWLRARRSVHRSVRRAFGWVGGLVLLQAGLGIATVMFAAQWHMALTHQLGAVLLWAMILRARFLAQYPIQQSIRG